MLAEGTLELLLVSLRLAILRVDYCPTQGKSMSFIDHNEPEKVFSETPTDQTSHTWSEDRMRKELQARGVWPASLSGNVENWYPQVLVHVRSNMFTFEEFADEFARQQSFDFGMILSRLTSPPGWYSEVMS